MHVPAVVFDPLRREGADQHAGEEGEDAGELLRESFDPARHDHENEPASRRRSRSV